MIELVHVLDVGALIAVRADSRVIRQFLVERFIGHHAVGVMRASVVECLLGSSGWLIDDVAWRTLRPAERKLVP